MPQKLLYFSSLLILLLLNSCDYSIDNAHGVKVYHINSYGEKKFKYYCTQSDGWGSKNIVIIDDVNKYNIGDTIVFVKK